MNNLRTLVSQSPAYHGIGLMSGTSLDGLDIVYCRFSFLKKKWRYRILAARTYPYSKEWKQKLSIVENKSAQELAMLHSEYGHFLGKTAIKFVSDNKAKVDFIASHGHTIFHQPEKKFTFQLGSGAAIAAETGRPVICDFRTLDVALGGQGAPLVPIGDKFLFPYYDYCLNLGGIANITVKNPAGRKKDLIAYDICPANMVLNSLANQLGKDYDKNGEIAKSGNTDMQLLKALNGLKYYRQNPPKSLGKEWVESTFFPGLIKSSLPIKNKLRTVVEHIAIQIGSQIPESKSRKVKMVITGGGAHNRFLVERIKAHCPVRVTIPDMQTINFKEALIFAFLGVLRLREETNCLSSVTGAIKNNCGGAIYFA